MAVKIEKISVKNLGPIKDLSISLGPVNLIYSGNESGKSFLAEFIIRSLFKNTDRWGYVREDGKGMITISGLEAGPTEFSPATKKKLEDYWVGVKGLPPSLAKLLIVKGGQAEIENTETGISRTIIKDILSGISLLDRIDSDDNISRTIKEANIGSEGINIAHRGEGNTYYNSKEKIAAIERLLIEVETKYAEGMVKSSEMEEKRLQDGIEILNKAKRHLAYTISEEIKKLETGLNKISEDELSQVESNLALFWNKGGTFKGLEKEYKSMQEGSKDFDWLQNALPIYRSLTMGTTEKPGKALLWISGSLSALTVFLILFVQKFLSILSFLAAVAVIAMYIKKFYEALRSAGQNKELDNIKKEFKARTGNDLSDIASLETILKEQERSNSKSEVLKRQIGDLERELQDLRFYIKQRLDSWAEDETEETVWEKSVKDLKEKNRSLNKQREDEKRKLDKLGIGETDYLHEHTGTEFRQDAAEKIVSELRDIQEKKRAQEDQLGNLKLRISQETKDDISINWDELIENLRKKREDAQTESRKTTSQIAAGIIVHKIISELRGEEDAKIQEGLDSDVVLKPLKELTQRYNRLELDGDNLLISDGYSNFNIKDLSTGALEQVMLALRIGFSSKLLKQDTLFLVLDDAFQHSDWPRREILVKQLLDIAKKGWQIIYLTMDDHIKGLFDQAGKEFKGGYKTFNII